MKWRWPSAERRNRSIERREAQAKPREGAGPAMPRRSCLKGSVQDPVLEALLPKYIRAMVDGGDSE